MWQVFCWAVNNYEKAKDTYFSHKPLAKSWGDPFPGMNSTVHPNNLLGVIRRSADLEGTSVLYYQAIVYHHNPLCKVIRFIVLLQAPFFLHSVSPSMRQGRWERCPPLSSSRQPSLLSFLPVPFLAHPWSLTPARKIPSSFREVGRVGINLAGGFSLMEKRWWTLPSLSHSHLLWM